MYYCSFHYTALSYVWWMVCRWMTWSGMLVLLAKCVGEFSLPVGDLVILFFSTLMADFGIRREYEDSSSDLIC